MRTPFRLFTLVLTVLVTLGLAPLAHAEEDKPSTYEQCISRTKDDAAANQMIKDGDVDRDEVRGRVGLTTTNNIDDVQKLKNGDQKDRFNEIREHYDEDKSFSGRAGRVGNAIQCRVAQPVEAAVGAAQDKASKFWNDPIGKFAKSVMEGNSEAFGTVMTFWMDFSTQSVDISANTQGVKNIVMGVSGLALAASFIIGGWRIASARRGGLYEGFADLNENMLRWLIFSIAVPVMFPGAMIASDLLAEEIMKDFGGSEALVNLGGLEDTQYGPVVTLALAAIMFIGSLVQILALVTRVLLAPIAAGLAPLFAALSFSDTGRQGLNHLVSFLIAAIAFKPISALLYAVVLWNTSQAGDIGVAGGVINALMLGIAGFSAPALVRALVPAVSQAGGGGAAPMLAGATGAVAGAAGMAAALAGGAGRAIGSAANGLSSGGGSGPSAAGTGVVGGSGAAGPAGPRGSASAASTASQPSGSTSAGGARTSTPSAASTPSGASGAGGGARPAGAGSRSRRVGQAAGRTMRGAGRAATASVGALASGARGVSTAGHHAQGLFDDSIGVPGSYAGQAHR